jgi:hypothetical protein
MADKKRRARFGRYGLAALTSLILDHMTVIA